MNERIKYKEKFLSLQTMTEVHERVPSAFHIAATVLNMTTREFKQALENKTIKTEEFFPLFKQAINKHYKSQTNGR